MEKLYYGVIPARKGSKGLPGKNLMPFCGYPLFCWSIAAALQSPTIDRCFVTTDCEKTQELAKQYGAEAPFLRPPSISGDQSSDWEFLDHLLSWLKESGDRIPHAFVLLRPTTPLRKNQWLNDAFQIFEKNQNLTSLRTISESPWTPYKMWKKNDGVIQPLLKDIPEAYDKSRLDLPVTFVQTGMLDIIKTETIEMGSASGDQIGFLEIPWNEVCDIDDLEDFNETESRQDFSQYFQLS